MAGSVSSSYREVKSAFREVGAERVDEFVAAGHRRRHFFPHRVYQLPKCGPDGFQLAARMCGNEDPAAMWELVLYADPVTVSELPAKLFFDDDLVWHQQQFGQPAQVATASVVAEGTTVSSLTLVADVVQRISRRREHKTRVEKLLEGWNRMLLNAVVAFAKELDAHHVRVPTSAFVARHTDRQRQVDLALFERIYDGTVNDMFPARRSGEWWTVDLAEARDRIVAPERRIETHTRGRVICICHEVERGLGHVDVEPAFSKRADEESPRHLAAMREIEADAGVRATYCVVGSLLDEVRDDLVGDGHCLAFHSFDHRLHREDQLPRCRQVDYRLKGYRPPRSIITPELTDSKLLFRNFEWMASAPRSLGVAAPELRAGLVRLPIALDDFPLHRGDMTYDEWERTALARIADQDFVAIGLHDCYGHHWLPSYRDFLARLLDMGELRTLDEVAAEITLASAA
jgi:hypothetical protein